MNNEPSVQTASGPSSGARFYKCAFQVNPFDYVIRHKKTTEFADEATYNAAITKKCQQLGIEIIAVTDHYRVRSSAGLWVTARNAGISVFPGFEAVTKDGIHLLCLFDLNRDIDGLERVLGACGIHEEKSESPTGEYDVVEFLAEARKWGGLCIAAHIASDGGLLTTLKGQPRIKAWQSADLLACSLPGPVVDAPNSCREILQNRNQDYRRPRPVAIINAQDVNSPADLERPGTSCWVKTSEVSIEGLRQAFLDPVSRIRLASDPVPVDHAEFVSIAWQGGFLDRQAIHFNENLNVLVGGRGAGKSTIIESLRHVLGLQPVGEEAGKIHDGIVRQVLRSGTKISLRVLSHRPSQREYVIERTIPNPPVVRDDEGRVSPLSPRDVIPGVEVYGQHELSELTRSPEKLTRLLERFMERDPEVAKRKGELKSELQKSRTTILSAQKKLKEVVERLASLPVLEETLKRYQEAGLEDRLRDQSLLVREESILKTTSERVSPFRDVLVQLRRNLPIDCEFLSPQRLEDLPGKDILEEANPVLDKLSRDLEDIAARMTEVLYTAERQITAIQQRWTNERQKIVQEEFEKILRDLQKAKVDGEEFIRLRRQIEELRPLKQRETNLQREEQESQDARRTLLVEWEEAKAREFRQLERAAGKVNRQLAGRVRVQVNFAGNREPLFDLLRQEVGGRLSEATDALRKARDLSLKELADALKEGRDNLGKKFAIPPAQADRLTQAGVETIMLVEELDLPPTTKIELNVAAEGQTPVWQALEELSTGQKATAVLLLLLLESEAPLVVDQPEDDLDNRFITEGIVPKMREEKCRRQFVFSTHNANIPVLGDAELIVGLRASGEAGQGRAQIPLEYMGWIDSRPVRELVEELLEGGREAFEMRRLKYGF